MNHNVAIIIPTKARNHLLNRSVGSVLRQDYPVVSIILVDDNVPERRVRNSLSCAWLEDPRVTIIENAQPLNASRARNLALANTDASWITYLDDDDEYCPEKVRKQFDLCSVQQVPLALCGYTRALPLRTANRQVNKSVYRGAEIYLEAHPGTPFIFHKRDDSLRFDESLNAHEDADFFYRAVKHFGLKAVHVVAEPLVIVHQQPDRRVNTQSVASWHAQRRIYYRHLRKLDRSVRRFLLLRMLLSRWKQTGRLGSLWEISLRLWKLDRLHMFRLLANAVLYRTPFLRRFVIS
jgi:glycosyltransferase involved in cell wall biosynthesis